jgi:leucyl/phenylalanyl-tRNA--protein transferase
MGVRALKLALRLPAQRSDERGCDGLGNDTRAGRGKPMAISAGVGVAGGGPRQRRSRSRALDGRPRLPPGHLPDGGDRTAGRGRLVVAGSAHVIRGCADPSREDGWISEDVVTAYTRLHELGWAHSVEVFDREGQLAGGLYGVRIQGLFAGESMFHLKRDASKVALMALVDLMRTSGMPLLDVQWCTDHLASLGAVAIARHEYLAMLADAVAKSGSQATQVK